MGRYIKANCRLCRGAGMKLFLKGTRCRTEKCAVAKRPTPPGSRSFKRRSKPTYYALQLQEKQKVKRMYGVMERQFRRFFDIANKSKGVTGKVLIQLLERRIDNVIYRALFAFSRKQARQMVNHGFIFTDAQRIDIPSYLIRPGQALEIRGNEKVKKDLRQNIEINSKDRSVPSWLKVNNEELKIEIVRLPEKEDLIIAVNEQLIVELYSK